MSFIKRYNGEGIISEIVVRRSELEELKKGNLSENIGMILAVKERLNQLQSTKVYYMYQNNLVIIREY